MQAGYPERGFENLESKKNQDRIHFHNMIFPNILCHSYWILYLQIPTQSLLGAQNSLNFIRPQVNTIPWTEFRFLPHTARVSLSEWCISDACSPLGQLFFLRVLPWVRCQGRPLRFCLQITQIKVCSMDVCSLEKQWVSGGASNGYGPAWEQIITEWSWVCVIS